MPSINYHFQRQIRIKLISRYLLLCIMLFLSNSVFSQASSVNINVQVLPPYTPYLSDYIGFKDKVVITLTNTTSNSQSIYLKAKLTSNTGFVAMTSGDYRPNSPIILNPNATIQLMGNNQILDFFNESNIDVDYGDYTLQNILSDGVLPDGVYTLCVDAHDINNDAQLNIPNLGCKSFNISYLNPPQLIKPSCVENSQVIKNEIQNIDFIWLPVNSSVQGLQFLYDLYIVKLNENDNPQDLIEMGIATHSSNIIEFKDIPITSYNLNFNNPIKLSTGHYAWAVKARASNGHYPLVNDGLSTVCTFEMIQGQMNFMNNEFNFDPVCECKAIVPINLANVSPDQIQSGSKIQTSNFEMEVNTFSHQEGVYSGDGYINLPILNTNLLKVKVSFKGIAIKKDGDNFIHTGGTIKAMVRDDAASLLPTMDGINPGQMQMGPGQTQALSEYFDQYSEQLISEIKKKKNTTAFLLPLGLDEKVMKIAIVNMVFSPDQAYFDAAAVLDIIDGNSKVGLIGQGICLDNNDFCGNAKLYLSQDFEIPIIGIKLKGGDPKEATSITFDKKGFKNLRLSAEYTFPEGSLVDANTKRAASVTLTCETEDGWSDWVADVKFRPFYINGFDDMIFGPDGNNTSMYYDHSDKKNPMGIPSPYKNSDNTDQIATDQPTWRGFYIPSIGLTLPAVFSNGDGNPIVVKAEKLIFDGGLSGNISVINILNIGNGSLDGWYYSIDEFKIDIWKNSFKQSSLKGKVVLPVSNAHAETTNQLDYTCTLSKQAQGGLDYQFHIFPKENIDFDIFWASGKLVEGTSIQIFRKNDGTFGAKAVLQGQLTLQTKIDDFPDVNLAEVHFRKLTFQTAAPHFSWGDTQATFFGLSSPQHSIAGFVIDLDPAKGRGVSLDPSKLSEGKIGIKFNALLKLVADVDFVPKAEVEFVIYGTFGMKDGRPDWKGFDADINNIKFDAGAKIGPVGIHGTIAYYNKQGSYGFMGALEMDIVSIVSVVAKAQFGYEVNGDYNYFFIDGLVDLPSGIPVGLVMGIYGFGGGVFYNMSIANEKFDGSNVEKSTPYIHDSNVAEPFVSLTGTKYSPKKGMFSVKGGVLFGTMPSRAIIDANGDITIEFNMVTGGVESIFFNLEGRFINNPAENLTDRTANCMAKLSIGMLMNFTEKSLIFNFFAKMGVPNHSKDGIFSLEANVDFYSDPNSWFIHVGRPWTNAKVEGGDPVKIKVLGKFEFKGYFQCGSGSGSILRNKSILTGIKAMDDMPPIPAFITNIINNNNRENENGSVDSEGNMSIERGGQKGGFAFGANFEAPLNFTFLVFYLHGNIMAGFDLAFYRLPEGEGLCKDEHNNILKMGVNNFYAKGQAYLGAEIDMGMEIDLFFFSGKFSFVKAGVAAYVKFGGPSPTYVTGAIGGKYNLLGGLVEGRFAMKFYIGDECTDLGVPEKIPLIAEVFPKVEFDIKNLKKPVTLDEAQSILTRPSVVFTYELDRTFLIIVPGIDSEKNNYRQYRYYHIRPEDVNISLNSTGTVATGKPHNLSLTKKDFDLSADHSVMTMNKDIVLQKYNTYTMHIDAKVLLYDLREASKNVSGGKAGYVTESEMTGVPTDRRNAQANTWDYASEYVEGTKKTFVDTRDFKFTTDCGISYIDDNLVVNVTPFHRTQNNPIGKSPVFNSKSLRSAKNEFTPVYAMPKTNKSIMKMDNGTKLDVQKNLIEGSNDLTLEIDRRILNEGSLCLPNGFEENFDFFLKVSTMNKRANGTTFNKKLLKANTSEMIATATWDGLFPEDSYVIIQLVAKKRSENGMDGAVAQVNSSRNLVKNYTYNGLDKLNLNINSRTLSLESKLASSASEMEFFRWYITTGKFRTYQEKMKELTISVDSTFKYISKLNAINKGGTSESTFTTKINNYKFYGAEKFSFHDINTFNLKQVFNTEKQNQFDPKLEDGFLGFAFDNKSQELVNEFLSIYFDSKESKDKYTGIREDAMMGGQLGIQLMNNYITEKMLESTRWNVLSIDHSLLQPLEKLPTNIFYAGSNSILNSISSSAFIKKQQLFSIEKLSRVKSLENEKTTIIPSHIINMKNLDKNLGGNGNIVFQARLADALNGFNNKVFNKVKNNFLPQFINDLNNKK